VSMSLFDLTGRVALITGSGQGIGLSLARGLASAGATVVLNDIVPELLDRAVAGCRADGMAAHGSAFDVTGPAEVAAAVAAVEETIGPIEILVNNAGLQIRAPLETSRSSRGTSSWPSTSRASSW
jgi:gluconate 5-dehydrogenase